MLKLLIATNNQGKQIEIVDLLKDMPIELLTPRQAGLALDVPEIGISYAENAHLKAEAFARLSGLLTLADDSGLEVDALGGAPGLHSARYVDQPGATDADRRTALLRALGRYPQPWTARFRCVVALARASGTFHFTEGICPGVIIPEERGSGGFGYDPIFYIPEMGKTMAELGMAEKNHLSHRALAILAVQPVLIGLLDAA
jgi:XTP/dITP diphosphohydrolase